MGKSTIAKLLKACLSPTYYLRVPGNTFSNNREAQVIMNTLEEHVRFIHVEDPPNVPLASSMLKTLCDGVVNCRVLFANGFQGK